ncbi:MAG: carbonic anhydrase [Nitrospinae bacterium]|nr:carbonic anhydrase [Nitrospinota bacterium]
MPDGSLQKLIEGNRRYVEGKSTHPHQDTNRRREVASGQTPFAAVLSCSDSRVPPEILFDCGLGDLFVVRVAGNIINDEILGSLEYATEHLGVSLIVVLGHQRCGAVQAAVEGGTVHGHIGSLIRAILPAVSQSEDKPGDRVDNAVRENIKLTTGNMKSGSHVLEEMLAEGKLEIAGAYYNLDSGEVEIF